MFPKASTYLPLFFLSVGAGYFLHQKVDNEARYHPTIEFAEIFLKLDDNVVNFTGENFKIKRLDNFNETKDGVSYTISFYGKHGHCKVLVDCNKLAHSQLKNFSNDQIIYSKKTDEQRSVLNLQMLDFNDVLVPTEKTIKKMTDGLKEKELLLYEYNRQKYINGDYYSTKDAELKAVTKEIESDDTFYWFRNIVMVGNGGQVFIVRPLLKKFRDYKIEDTFYKNKSYHDVLIKMMQVRNQYNEALKRNTKMKEKNRKNEDLHRQKYSFQVQCQKMAFLASCFVIFAYIIYKIEYNTPTINQLVINSLNMLLNTLNPKNLVGKRKKLLYVDYFFLERSKQFHIVGTLMSDKGVCARVETYTAKSLLSEIPAKNFLDVTLQYQNGTKEIFKMNNKLNKFI